MKIKTILITTFGVLLGGFPETAVTKDENSPSLQSRVTRSLTSDGQWTQKAADAYWGVNERRLKATESVASDFLEKETKSLREVRPEGKVLSLLENHPETSGLVLLAGDRKALAAAIMDASEADQGMLVASYVFCTGTSEVDDWTAAVKRHPAIISLLQRKCAALPFQGLFSYLTTMKLPDARRIYGEWLDEVMAPAVIGMSDETLSSRLNFAGSSSMVLRGLLDGNPDFRKVFLTEIWPRFRDCIVHMSQTQGKGADVFYLCGSEPLIWDFFRREDSKVLFENAGMDAVTMLTGDKAITLEVKEVAAALLAAGVLDLPRSIQHYEDDANFRVLVKALGDKNNWGLLNAVVLRLAKNGTEWPQEAKVLAALPVATLRKELNPKEPSMIPGASLVNLVSKALDGRPIRGQDWLGAGFDVVDLVMISVVVLSDGTATPLLTAERKILQQTLKTGAKEGAERLAGRTLEQLVVNNTKVEWTQMLGKKAMESLPSTIREIIAKGGVVDITRPVKAGFELSRRLGMGREPFKKITGMEARVFMRQDGRVFINFTNVLINPLVKPNPAVSFLTRTLENSAAQSEPAGHAVRGATNAFRQWQEDVSAWWSGHATGQF